MMAVNTSKDMVPTWQALHLIWFEKRAKEQETRRDHEVDNLERVPSTSCPRGGCRLAILD